MQQIILYDGFYSDPKQMQTLFSTLDYVKNENLIGGLICPLNFANEDMLRHMEHITAVPENTYEYVDGSGSFVINTESDLPTQTVCVNLPDLNTHWVGVLPLSDSEQSHYLKFYKHKRTGWEHIPNTPDQLNGENIKSFDELQQFLSDENVDFSEKWEETTRIKFKQNQLILFRPAMFHSYSDVYGETKETGRLLQFFFLKPKSP